jgi:short subunit dehydrogenase-like uncharacterized protein
MQAVKSFDVVVLGASGFTGRLVCEHIARDYQVGDGRDQQGDTAAANEVAAHPPVAPPP